MNSISVTPQTSKLPMWIPLGRNTPKRTMYHVYGKPFDISEKRKYIQHDQLWVDYSEKLLTQHTLPMMTPDMDHTYSIHVNENPFHVFQKLLSYGTIHPLDIQDIDEIVTEGTGETRVEYYRNNVYLYTKKFQVPFSGSIQFPEKTIDYYVTPINKMSCTIHYRTKNCVVPSACLQTVLPPGVLDTIGSFYDVYMIRFFPEIVDYLL